MLKKYLLSLIFIFFLIQQSSFAVEDSKTETTENLSTGIIDNSLNFEEFINESNILSLQISAMDDFQNAVDKFKQSNIEVAYDEFKNILNSAKINDFGYVLMANKFAEYGFFDLSELAIKKMSDKEIVSKHSEDLKKFFYPSKELTPKNEIYLAEMYANIIYNDQSKESLDDLLKQKDLLKNSDYANYMLALAAYKSNNNNLAKQYINNAVSKNQDNVNYKILQAQILADGSNPNSALKVVENLKKQNISVTEFKRRINSIEQYVLYKNAQKDWLKNYHLGYYYFYQAEYNKSIRALQNALGKNKSNNAKINALLSKVYFTMNDYDRAKDYAQKAIKKNKYLAESRMISGKLNYRNGNYDEALKDFEISKKDKTLNFESQIKIAEVYSKKNDIKKSNEIYENLNKSSKISDEGYYSIATVGKLDTENNLKKALGINIKYTNAWLELANNEIKKNNFGVAHDYLSSVYYIDKNDYRYYYYQGLIYKYKNDTQIAELYFQKCLQLNPKFTEVKKELKI
ncbi:tetratricopeptide repeat protein [bacterium]|nr:tetratricopeptide repeat protein [bacterium]